MSVITDLVSARAMILINWRDAQTREEKTSILAYVDEENRTFWNRSHQAQPEELWKQDLCEMTDNQLLDATRATGSFLGMGWITQGDADLLLDNLNAEILKRHESLTTKPKGKRKLRRDSDTTTPAPMITDSEAAENLKKGKHT